MKDKVSELRKILNDKKSADSQKKQQNPVEEPSPEDTQDDIRVSHKSKDSQTVNVHLDTSTELPAADLEAEIEELQKQNQELQKANQLQKDMYMRQVADFDNFKKRLQKEQDELVKYSNEKILEELFPIMDNLEMTLSHVEDQNDPIAQGVTLTLKEFVKTLEKFGVKQISGQGEPFDPNFQEAIGTEEVEGTKPNIVVKVHRKGYVLNNKLIRAAMVTVSK